MAFSYSDKNFTVIGNLCFVHILLDGTKRTFYIPPAISDRMLFGKIICTYSYYVENNGSTTPNTSFAIIRKGTINCKDVGDGYLFCYFPIDSNK